MYTWSENGKLLYCLAGGLCYFVLFCVTAEIIGKEKKINPLKKNI